MIKKTLYFSNPAYLSLSDGQLVIKMPEVENCQQFDEKDRQEFVRTIPIEDIGMVVIDNRRVTLTSGLMAALLDNNCSVVSCDNRNMPVGLMLPLAGNSIQNERFRSQLSASLPLKKQLWQQTVSQKIANQCAILKRNTSAETGCMSIWANDVRSGDPDNLEARAAAYYWRNIFPDIPHFVRDREGDFPNNLLNYGYAILRAVIARALVGSGLLPTLGIHHQNRYNAYCLADDIMEPYRPIIDQLVIETMRESSANVSLSKDVKAKLLTIPVLDVTIRGKSSPLMVAATQTSASLFRCFDGEQRKIDYPEIKP